MGWSDKPVGRGGSCVGIQLSADWLEGYTMEFCALEKAALCPSSRQWDDRWI